MKRGGVALRLLCYNHVLPGWRYRLGVRTEDSQSSNPGSIPGSATKSSFCYLVLLLVLCQTSSKRVGNDG